MRHKLFLAVALCLVCFLSGQAQNVIESESNISFTERAANVSLVVENPQKSYDALLEVELLDAENKVRGRGSQKVLLETGKKSYTLAAPHDAFSKTDEENLIWFRLRWRVGAASGVASVSELLHDVFELRVIASELLVSGMKYRSRVRALDPATNKSVGGVRVDAEMELELKGDGERTVKLAANGETDADGFATLDFEIPIDAEYTGEGEIKVTGRKDGIYREARESLQTPDNDYSFLIFADKPIYQPEQMLNVRGILMKGGEGKTVLPGAEVEFRVEDEEDTVLYREKVKTSDFGVAAISWKIPENAKLGDYRIRVRRADGEDGNYVGWHRVKISRYDLPNFAVNAKATKSFYLPDEKEAEVEVSADYLFGKPVTKGKVRVVRENSREWNWKEQKYDIDEGDAREGEVDKDGKFTAKFDLSEDHEDLADDDWDKFEDLKFSAYLTDLTTNKTEQRRFDVRVTKEPIHVYFVGERYNQHAALPVTAYVSTFYADGTPAVCDVELKGREEDGDDEKYKTIQRIKTNEFGAGKLNFMRPQFEDAELEDDLEFRLLARDKNGLKGTFGGEDTYGDTLEFSEEDVLRLRAEKTIYKPGETVKIEIDSSLKTGLIYIDVVQGWSVVDSHFVNLKNGKASLKIPYNPAFKGELKLAAFTEDAEGSLIRSSRGIIFPAQTNLRLTTEFDKEYYKPGEDARVGFGVLDAVGSAVEAALGVVIFDKAVEERARTDADFGGMFADYSGWLGYGDSFGGINVKNLNELDLSKPISDDMQTVAEVILYDNYYYPNIFRSRTYDTDAKSVYADYFKKQSEPIEKVLSEHYKKQAFEHPTDEASLRRILNEYDINFDALRDPWEQKYRAVFETEKTQNIVRIETAGADKTFGTRDDFTISSSSFLYFTPTGNAIDRAFENYYKRTGGYIRDEKTLFAELGLTDFKDRFGRPYQIKFEVQGRYFVTKFRSFGKDGVNCECTWQDDFEVWANRTDYFAATEVRILSALQTTKNFPLDETEFKSVLRAGDVDFDALHDGYGEKYYLVRQRFSRYTDKVIVEKVRNFGDEKESERTVIKPVTQEVIVFNVRGRGADRTENTSDDTMIAQFLHIISEQSKDDEKPKPVVNQPVAFSNGTGAIGGTVTDSTGAVVPNATVTATNNETQASSNTTTNDSGVYLIANLPAGKYSVKASATAFKDTIVANVPVTANNTAKVDFALEPGNVSSVVEVTASADSVVNTTSSAVSSQQVSSLPISARNIQEFVQLKPGVVEGEDENASSSQKSTPRLREYFPETLVWSPELLTDAGGKASLNFKTADNITTWKLYTIASTKTGKIGVAEKEITVFQPFFVDLEPPKFLTDGDEIHLPTQVRNYTNAKQKVDVTMAKSDWFTLLSPERQTIEVGKNAAANAVFGFRAGAVVKDGKQRVTAIAAKDSDAIEKPVTVRPNGQEIVRTESVLFDGSAALALDFPANALPKTAKAELKIYPNLMAHVTESVEGLLQRPYGCGEQTISSTYPNLMILKFKAGGAVESALERKARRYLQKGYERLLGYQVADGGFSYWGGKSESDLALTAYALRFLSDAKGVIEIDESVVEKALQYLVKQQRADGSFTRKYYWETSEDTRRTKLFTSYVARTLAMLKAEKSVLEKALGYLKTRNAEIDEPYALALYGLASLDTGNVEEARGVAQRLEKMAIAEGDKVYWNLETNTPFYGWGTAGRIETTALVTQLLVKLDNGQRTTDNGLISKATMFLLKSKDRYGVWYSTQTTINVLDAFLASLTKSASQTIAVTVGGEKMKDFAVSAEQIEPIVIDLTGRTANEVKIESSNDAKVMAQVVRTHYIDWKDSVSANRDVNASRAIRLDYKCDRQAAKIMETVTCAVEAERVGFQGYGMLLAEIGLPPGADVSRESLEKAFEADWSLSRYDVLPDRIVVYMWAKAGGSKFNFSFKPRYGINAQTPSSTVYDYYNEEAKAVVKPLRFEVK